MYVPSNSIKQKTSRRLRRMFMWPPNSHPMFSKSRYSVNPTSFSLHYSYFKHCIDGLLPCPSDKLFALISGIMIGPEPKDKKHPHEIPFGEEECCIGCL